MKDIQIQIPPMIGYNAEYQMTIWFQLDANMKQKEKAVLE